MSEAVAGTQVVAKREERRSIAVADTVAADSGTAVFGMLAVVAVVAVVLSVGAEAYS